MEALIITVVAGTLCWFDVITPGAFISIVFGSLVLSFAFVGLYFKFGFLKCYYHDLLGWHTPDNSPHYHDGLSEHAKCKHCGKDIMQDSQGNWF